MRQYKVGDLISSRFKHFLQLAITLLLIYLSGAAATHAANGAVSLVSVNRVGTTSGNGGSLSPRLSASGRFVVFSSGADDLVANDSNAKADVFVRDLLTGATILVSVDSTGTRSANGDSSNAIISANGRFVVFTSFASNLVSNDNNNLPDLFVRDLRTGVTKIVSINRAGTNSGNDPTLSSVYPAITPDGRFVAFYSDASDLAANDANTKTDLFVRDLTTETTALVSVNARGVAAGTGESFVSVFTPSISHDGRFIAFQSQANDLVTNDPQRAGGNQDDDVFVRDMAAGTTILVSVNRTGTASANAPSTFPVMSADGRFVAFTSYATNLVENDANFYRDIYVRDREAGTTTLVSVNSAGATSNAPSNTFGAPAISADGRFVAFASIANDLVANDTNNRIDIFRRDLQAKTTMLVSQNSAGTSGGNDDSRNPIISPDGRFVAFESLAGDLAGVNDANGRTDIFVRDTEARATTLVSVNNAGNGSGNEGSFAATMSADGQFVAFDSDAGNLAANDTNNQPDVFVRAGILQLTPALLTEEGTGRAIALDSVTFLRDPFPIFTTYNFSSDGRTRIMLFATSVEFAPGEQSSILTAQAEDSQHGIYPLAIEYVGEVPNFYWLTQVVVKLPDQLESAGDVSVSINLRGRMSNAAVVRIKPSEQVIH